MKSSLAILPFLITFTLSALGTTAINAFQLTGTKHAVLSSLQRKGLTYQNTAADALPPASSSKHTSQLEVLPQIGQSRLFSSSSTAIIDADMKNDQKIGKISAAFTKIGMVSFIASLCVSLPLVLLPTQILHKARILNKTQREIISLRLGQFCCRWSLRLIPFANVKVIASEDGPKKEDPPEPSIWVCNHTSMLDVFFLLAVDKKMRGSQKRPIKIVYWKQLEDNPVTKFLFRMCGFIPVAMTANKPGEENKYDTKSFKTLLRSAKEAFKDGFDIGILPEGQLNPNPESGLLPVFPGAFTLAKMSRRPIKMLALNGAHNLWHPTDGMKVRDRNVIVRAYLSGKKYDNSDDFLDTFTKVVGYFGAQGKDVDDYEKLFQA